MFIFIKYSHNLLSEDIIEEIEVTILFLCYFFHTKNKREIYT